MPPLWCRCMLPSPSPLLESCSSNKGLMVRAKLLPALQKTRRSAVPLPWFSTFYRLFSRRPGSRGYRQPPQLWSSACCTEEDCAERAPVQNKPALCGCTLHVLQQRWEDFFFFFFPLTTDYYATLVLSLVFFAVVCFCVRWYRLVQTGGAANKVGSQRSHQGGVRWEDIEWKPEHAAFGSRVFNLLWNLTDAFHFVQEHMATWSVYLIISCALRTQSWWICTRECILAGRMTPMCPCLYPGSRKRVRWRWMT